jgi:nitroreductase
MTKKQSVPFEQYKEYSVEEMQSRSQTFYEMMKRRRSIRSFAKKGIHPEVIDNCIKAAATAPSGANKQPWQFTVISSAALKKEIRTEAERHEQEFYSNEKQAEWHNDLDALNTNSSKPFLEDAPYLIVVFKQIYGLTTDGEKTKHYYVNESVNIAVGILISALQNAGLSMLTYTPSRMTFLRKLCGRPKNERPVMIIATGYPAENAEIPAIGKKDISEVISYK